MTRRELIEAVGERYRKATGENRRTILDEFIEVTGYHRKHVIRLFGATQKTGKLPRENVRKIYDEAVRQALIMLWEAGDRICGKRLKPLLSILIEAMERHGHLKLEAKIKQALLLVSAATIDRLLSKVRESAKGVRRKRGIATPFGGASRYARSLTGKIRPPAIWKQTWSPIAAAPWKEVLFTALYLPM